MIVTVRLLRGSKIAMNSGMARYVKEQQLHNLKMHQRARQLLLAMLKVALGGVTNGGKTSVCRKLNEDLSKIYSVKSIHLDEYFRDESDPNHIRLKEFNHHDWESANSLHIDKFVEDIQKIIKSSSCDIFLIEGFLIFNIEELKNIYDKAYYFDLTETVCRERRIKRNYGVPDPVNYFDKHVWPEYVKAKEQAFLLHQNLICVDGSQPFQDTYNKILAEINDALAKNKT
ncbi:unnamed protein product [Didymodactylos carnosus]|uniref:Uncharacterized protein n=1 Tax=Didymodactylos carnosus TaxID=1234261 RepID=A0A8S2CNL0_9BILA|nr:unnamed protein product [Didymodactylos carnosus]CAF3539028.1 unnamed protein product [Didymodactylos carnosus]